MREVSPLTVSAQTPINRSTGNGVTTVFPYTFKIISSADMEVSVDGVVKTLTVDYTLSGVGNDAGGNVTMLAAPATSTSVVRRRNMALTRNTDYQDQGELPAPTLDSDLDSAVLMIQQVDEKTDRAMVLPADVSGFSTELPTPIANYFLRVNSAGTALELASEITPGALTVTPFIETLLNDSTQADARTTLDAAASGANTDITSLGAVASINGGQLAGLRNRIINGGMQVNQRGVAGTLPSTFSYSLDRWLVSSASAVPAASQSATNSAGSQLSNTLAVTGAAGNTGVNIRHRIEAANCLDMAGQTVTLSWWAYQSTGSAMNVTCSLAYATTSDNFTSVTSIGVSSATVVPSGGNFTRITAAFAVPAAATTGLEVVLFANTPVLLGAQVLGATNVQLEIGSVATPFEQRPYGMELALCQRHYQKYIASLFGGYTTATNPFFFFAPLSVVMRSTPSVTFKNLSYSNTSNIAVSLVSTSLIRLIQSMIVTGYGYSTFDLVLDAEL